MKNNTTCLRITVDKDKIDYEKKQLILKQDIFSEKEKIYSLLGSEVRLKIVYLLLKYERLCVCDISDMLDMKQSPVSQHLRKLKDANILFSKREGLLINYYISDNYIKKLSSFLD